MSDGTGGLGLSIVRSVVTAHGGQVSIQSQEGKGTTPLYPAGLWGLIRRW